jgi:hypothetical protein
VSEIIDTGPPSRSARQSGNQVSRAYTVFDAVFPYLNKDHLVEYQVVGLSEMRISNNEDSRDQFPIVACQVDKVQDRLERFVDGGGSVTINLPSITTVALE